MSILIKGMEMPTTCCNCKFREPFIGFVHCHLAEMDMEYEESDNCRHPDCPLIELPPHGRLIDADAIQDYNVETFGQRLLIIDTAPTVIEAEGET